MARPSPPLVRSLRGYFVALQSQSQATALVECDIELQQEAEAEAEAEAGTAFAKGKGKGRGKKQQDTLGNARQERSRFSRMGFTSDIKEKAFRMALPFAVSKSAKELEGGLKKSDKITADNYAMKPAFRLLS